MNNFHNYVGWFELLILSTACLKFLFLLSVVSFVIRQQALLYIFRLNLVIINDSTYIVQYNKKLSIIREIMTNSLPFSLKWQNKIRACYIFDAQFTTEIFFSFRMWTFSLSVKGWYKICCRRFISFCVLKCEIF